jgi:hypothetical protein
MITEFFMCLFRAIWLPVAPAAEDRIDAHERYKRLIGVTGVASESRKGGSVLSRLSRATVRQKKINAINLPEFYKNQQNKRSRSHAWVWMLRWAALFASMMYAVGYAEPLLQSHCPVLHQILAFPIITAGNLASELITVLTPS